MWNQRVGQMWNQRVGQMWNHRVGQMWNQRVEWMWNHRRLYDRSLGIVLVFGPCKIVSEAPCATHVVSEYSTYLVSLLQLCMCIAGIQVRGVDGQLG